MPLGVVGSVVALACGATAWIITEKIGTRFELRFVHLEYRMQGLESGQELLRRELERQGVQSLTREEWRTWVERVRDLNSGLVTPPDARR